MVKSCVEHGEPALDLERSEVLVPDPLKEEEKEEQKEQEKDDKNEKTKGAMKAEALLVAP